MKKICAGAIILIVSFLLILTDSAFANTSTERPAYQQRSIRKHFRIPKNLEHEVQFWKDIYSRYDRNQAVIHDPENLAVVYQVVDFSDIHPLGDPFAPLPETVREQREDRVEKAKEKIANILQKFAKKPQRKGRGVLEHRVRSFFPANATAEDFTAAAESKRLRSQTGLRDRFKVGIERSGRYLDQIEVIFQEEEVPWEITRLAFVESMFDLRAYSKVGASGVWQFMPGTAKIMGLAINDVIDERNDPIAATRAAARLLMKNFRYLGSWPLAINAYNAGPGRMKQAVKTLGTNNIGKIIHNFEHRAYGFASRNFYPTFLAALYTFEDRDQHFTNIALAETQRYDTLITTHDIALPDLAKSTGETLENLWQLNPGLASAIYKGELMLPAGHALHVPHRQSKSFLAAMKRLPLPVATKD